MIENKHKQKFEKSIIVCLWGQNIPRDAIIPIVVLEFNEYTVDYVYWGNKLQFFYLSTNSKFHDFSKFNFNE